MQMNRVKLVCSRENRRRVMLIWFKIFLSKFRPRMIFEMTHNQKALC